MWDGLPTDVEPTGLRMYTGYGDGPIEIFKKLRVKDIGDIPRRN